MLKGIFPSADKIYLQGFPKVIVLKRSTNIKMSCIVRGAPCTYLSINQKSGKIQCLSKLFEVLVALMQCKTKKRSKKRSK